MRKKTKITLLVIAILLVGGLGIGVIVYDQATDYLIANVFESLLREDLAKEGMLGADGELTEEAIAQLASHNQANSEAANSQPAADDLPAGKNEEAAQAGEQATGDSASEAPAEQSLTTVDKKPTSSGQSGTTSSAKPSQNIEQRVKEIVKGIPIRDKNAVMRLVMQNVSSNDIRYLSGLVTDGNVSGSDIAKAKEVALRSFTTSQLEDVKYYYYKYIGLFSEFF